MRFGRVTLDCQGRLRPVVQRDKRASPVPCSTLESRDAMPKVVDHAKRRDEIAQAACQAVANYGFEHATVARIARAAGYTTGMLAHYFESKQEIILAALRLILQRIEQRARQRAGGAGELGLEKLAAAAGEGLGELLGADLGNAMAEIGMADLMADDGDEIGLAGAIANKALVDADLAARQRPGVDLVVVENNDLPGKLLALGGRDQRRRQALHGGLDRGIAIEAALRIDDAAIERVADLDLILLAE